MAKRIVICADGTWNTPDQKDKGKVCPSNVAKAALMVAPAGADGRKQIVYYDKGVGTEWYDHIRGGMSGVGISENIKEAYQYLIENYEDGDELFLLGFSRGAYTVRSLAGFIRNCGLLLEPDEDLIEKAYALYRRRDDLSHPASVEATLFRKTYSREIRIKFIGVWDTVGALGIPVEGLDVFNRFLNVEFHDVKLSSWVENAFQALAIDEKRAAFRPCIWQQQENVKNQCLEQTWFAGVHTNVGGGYVESGLSDITLLWMKKKAESCGLAFDMAALKEQNLDVVCNAMGVIRNSKKGFYKLFRDYIRDIGVSAGAHEEVSEGAIKRYDNDTDYKPENLRKYFAMKTVVRVRHGNNSRA